MEEEKRDPKEIAAEIIDQGKIDQAKKYVKSARSMLLVVAALTLIQNLIAGSSTNFGEDFYFGLIDVVLFIGLFALSFKYPKIIFIVALLLYVIPHVYLGIVSPENIFKGIILKLVIVVVLVRGIIATAMLPKTNLNEDDELLDNF